jgi:hypothetical protein
MKKFISTHWGSALLAFCSAVLLAAIIFPEFLIDRHLEFVRGSFYADYWGSFTLTNFFYQGGIQLWDPYDQIPMAYPYFILGIGKFFNVLVSLVYILFSPLTTFNADFFEQAYSGVAFMGNLFLKAVGSYLLFRKLSSSRAIAILAGIYFSVIASAFPFITGGLSYGSYIPLLVYLTLNVFEQFRLQDILRWALFFCILLSNDVLYTGFLYQGIHFMVLAGVVWVISRRQNMANPFKNWRGTDLGTILLTAGACLLIILPVIYLVKAQMGDMDLGSKARSAELQFWNWHSYFTRHMEFGSTRIFLVTLVDYSRNLCWTCVGYVVVFFALFGLAMSRDRRKYIFLTPLMFIWMLNHPRENFPFGFLAHALNWLTNPLSFSVRLFGEVHVYFLPVWLMCLAVIGFESFRGYMKAPSQAKEVKRRLQVFGALLFLFLILTLPQLTVRDMLYCLLQTFLSLLAVWSVFKKYANRERTAVLLGLCVALDVCAMIYHVRLNMMEPYKPRMHIIEGRPELGLVGVNEQNPSIVPYRKYFDLFVYNDPDNSYLFSRAALVPGIFYRYTDLARDFSPGDEQNPRPKAYSSWDKDGGKMQRYLTSDKRLISASDDAVMYSRDDIEVGPAAAEKPNFSVMPFNVTNDFPPFLKDGLAYYQFPLGPKILSKYFASTFLTDDQNSVQFYVMNAQGNGRRLQPVQGQIVRPWTFDVNNIRTGYLTAAFLPQDYPAGQKFVLVVPAASSEGITDIWKWQFDNLGFNYAAPKEQWLVFRYPYDRKWSITVDGQDQKVYRVNKSFMGIHLKKGVHKVLLRYWPQTPLRGLLLVSIVLSAVLLFVLIHNALRDKAFIS